MLFTACGAISAQAQTLVDYELEITSPLDGGSGANVYFSNATEALNAAGNMTSTGTDTSVTIYRLAGVKTTDFFGNVDYAYNINSAYNAGSNYMSGSGSTDYLSSDNGTMSMLFQTSSDITTFQSLLSRGIYNTNGDNAFEIRVGNGRLQIAYGGTSLYNIDTTISIDTWYYLGITWDVASNTMDIFYGAAGSGSLETSTISIASAGNSSDLIYVGGRNGSGEFLGSLEEIAIWDRTLSDSSMEAQFAATVPEPATTAMSLGIGVCALTALLRRKSKH